MISSFSWQKISERANRYGPEITSYDWLKFIAVILMTIDHIGYYLLTSDPLWWRAIGRITFPVWFFMAGYSQSRKLGGEILWLGLLLQIVNFVTYHGINPLNALFSIIICRYVVFWLKNKGWVEKYPFEILVACIFLSPFTTPIFEYGTLGILFAVMGDMVRRGFTSTKYQIYFWLSTVLFLIWQFIWFNFNLAQAAVVILGSCYTVWYLARFELKPIRLFSTDSAAASIVRLLARNTMHYYVAHRALFQATALLLGITQTDNLPIFIY